MQQGSTVIPSVSYKDAHAAISWLERAFGFERHVVYPGPDNTVEHAELRHGTGMVMLGSVRTSGPYAAHGIHPSATGGRVTGSVYLVVADCTPVWNSARAAGAEVVMEPQTMSYGGAAFTVRDPEGFLWSFGEYDPWAEAQGPEAAQPASDQG